MTKEPQEPPNAGCVEVASAYQAITPDDFQKGFFARPSTDAYIEALASLDAVTLYAGAGVSADVGAPLSDELMPWVLLRLLGDAETDLTDPQRERVVTALEKTYSPAYLGSIAREYARLRGNRDDPDKWASFVHHLNTALAAGRNTGGFLARSLGALAFAFRKAGKETVQVFTTNYDDKINQEEGKIHNYFPELAGYSFKLYTLRSDCTASDRDIPLYHLNGDLRSHDGSHPAPLVIGEADFFGRYGHNLMPLTDDHDRRSQLLDAAFTDTACLFVGSSLTDPDVLAKLADTKYQQRRYAIVLTPPLHLENPDERAVALNLIAQRFLHLGIIPIIIDFPHQVPQLLIEVAIRLQAEASGATYSNYVKRLDDWWMAWAKKFGFKSRDGEEGGKRDEKLQLTWMKSLAKIRDRVVKKYLKLPARLDQRDEQIQLEVWVRHPGTRSLILWATSEGMWLHSNTAHRCQIDDGEEFAAQGAFRQGQAVHGKINPPRGRWRYQVSMPLILHKHPWHHLPVGVVSVLSSKGPVVKDENGDVILGGGKLSAFIEAGNLAEELAGLEDDIKRSVNDLLDPNSKV